MRAPALLPAVLATALLAACGGYAPSAVRPGQSAGDVAATMGPPTGRYTLPQGGTRLEYARGPMGRHTYMVDLDAGGRVTGWTQVLGEANFLTIAPGMTREELLARIGRPGEVKAIPRQGLRIWNYRYPTNDCLWFQVSLNAQERVSEAAYGIDPSCDPGDAKPSQ